MTRIILAIALAGFASVPAFAMDDMSCADFTAMDTAKQGETVSMMSGAEGTMQDDSGGAMMATDDATADEDMTAKVSAACAEHPDMMLGEAMQGAMSAH